MKGEVVYQFAFDVANEILTKSIPQLLNVPSAPLEIRADHTIPKDVPLYKPFTIELPPSESRLRDRPVETLARVFEVGVVTVVARVPFEVRRLEELRSFHAPLLDSGETIDELAKRVCRDICRRISAAIVRGEAPSEPEAYTVFCLTELDGETNTAAWFARERRAVAGLLAESDAATLSELQVEESLRVCRSFSHADLTVIDWDAALAVELDGYADDVLYALELANLQLEEFHVMDRRLDQYLEEVYKDLESYKLPLVGTPKRTLERLRRFRVDATKLTDEVTHITKFFGDWHLARVYLGAAERFHLQEWRQSVEQRLSQLDQVYTVIQSEVYERRMLWLEVAVVICFIVDLLAIFFWKG